LFTHKSVTCVAEVNTDLADVYLADGGKGGDLPERLPIFSVLASSPDLRPVTDFKKHVGAAKVYMPCWSWEEIELVYPHYQSSKPSLSRDEVVERFKKFGGIPRYIYGGPSWEDELLNAIETFSIGAMTRFVYAQEESYLIQYHPSAGYTTASYDFASEYVKKEVPTKLAKNEKTEAIKLVKTYLQGIPMAAALRGWLFESIVHEELKSQKQFTLSSSSRPVLKIDVQNSPIFSLKELNEIQEAESKDSSWKPNTYYQPLEKIFSQFDSFYYLHYNTLVGFQITVSAESKKKFDVAKAVDNYVDNNFVKRLLIVFVVPPDIAPSFAFPKNPCSDEATLALLSLPM